MDDLRPQLYPRHRRRKYRQYAQPHPPDNGRSAVHSSVPLLPPVAATVRNPAGTERYSVLYTAVARWEESAYSCLVRMVASWEVVYGLDLIRGFVPASGSVPA